MWGAEGESGLHVAAMVGAPSAVVGEGTCKGAQCTGSGVITLTQGTSTFAIHAQKAYCAVKYCTVALSTQVGNCAVFTVQSFNISKC